MKNPTDLYIGLMSGTSIDGVDVALVDLSDNSCHLLASYIHPIATELKLNISDLSSAPASQRDNINRIELMALVDVQMGQVFADAVNKLLSSSNLATKQIAAIGSHGQTIRHRPSNPAPFTLQIGDANIIAEKTGITTVADFRRADIAAGGQGAPLAPAFHNAILRIQTENRIILNLGGIANITHLPKKINLDVIGFDTGPANTLLDAWFTKSNPTSSNDYDTDSNFAQKGKINSKLLKSMLSDPYFEHPFPKSTGREYFCLNWLEQHLVKLDQAVAAEDVQRTLVELTTQTIADEVTKLNISDAHIYACGGGMHNRFLLESLSEKVNKKVLTTNDLGIDGDYLEAMTFAWLAKQRIEGKPGNLRSVTGSTKEKRLGAIYLP